jgi:hypothetical protein
MRRLIRHRLGRANLSMHLPHPESQLATPEEIQNLLHPDELGLQSWRDLPETALLIEQPRFDELEHWPIEDLKLQVWRRVFHGQIDRLLLPWRTASRLSDVQSRIAKLGQVEFDEAHHVLRHEQRLNAPDSRVEAFLEWVAHYWEFRKFEPDSIATWFPSIGQRRDCDELFRLDLPIDQILSSTKLTGTAAPELVDHESQDEMVLNNARRIWSLDLGQPTSDRHYHWTMRRRDRAMERGNTVRAITSSLRAARAATSRSKRSKAETTAESDLRVFVKRLREAIGFSQHDALAWHRVLLDLSRNSIEGFWNPEKRLLYDLQKVCLDNERTVYRIDLLRSIASGGARPLRTPLLNLKEVLMAKHLASAASRLVYVRLSGNEREQLTHLLEQASEQAESQMRNRIREPLRNTLLDVGMLPSSYPEEIALDKLVEDALDCISERGYISMGYFRDAVSKNDLKLPDLLGIQEAWSGDRLLKADDRLDRVLEGVYRRGDFYLRWVQMFSALFFGTRTGRFATLFLIIPFGGALVVIESIRHIWHTIAHWTADHPTHAENLDGDSPTNEIQENSLESSGKNPGGKNPDGINPTVNDSSSPLESIRNLQFAGEPRDTPQKLMEFEIAQDRVPQQESNAPPVDESESPQWTRIDSFGLNDLENTESTVAFPPKTTDQAVDQIVSNQLNIIPLVLLLGFFLMGLIHLPSFRLGCWKAIRWGLLTTYALTVELPRKWLPWNWLEQVLRHRLTVDVWRLGIKPVGLVMLLEWSTMGSMPKTMFGVTRMILQTLVLSSLMNTRLGRDIQEWVFEGFGRLWTMLRARWFWTVIEWIVDLFRWMLLTLERFLYAVDEWLRFHNQESPMSMVAKAVIGFAWSIVSFLIRIYVNLLIEPTFHPVKHFPVVTVAHKIFLPVLLILAGNMESLLIPYFGRPMAMSITWFHIFFLPGFFGFAVWELKENWRLFRENRQPFLKPVPIGSHGETMERLLRPGFHSGTVPKLYRRLRRLEHQPASFQRFTKRRATLEQLHHVTKAVERFVDREWIALLNRCVLWKDQPLTCDEVTAATNSLTIHIRPLKPANPSPSSILELLIQEQSGRIIAWISNKGWLEQTTQDQQAAFELACEGFFRKSGVFFIRSQVESKYTRSHPYDVQDHGLVVWVDAQCHEECSVVLDGAKVTEIRPSHLGEQLGLFPVPDKEWIFAAGETSWNQWQESWQFIQPLPEALSPKHSTNYH